MREYKTYRFKDKDPLIDMARTCIQIHAALRRVSFWKACKEVSKLSGVHERTLWNWFYGPTRSPICELLVAVVHATGDELRVGKQGTRRRFRSIKGGRAA